MPNANQFPPVVAYDKQATIASGQTVSGAVDLEGCALVGAFLPATLDGTALTFLACDTAGGTYLPVHDADGDEVTATVAASRYLILDPADFAGVRYLKLEMGTAQSTTDTTITLAVRPV